MNVRSVNIRPGAAYTTFEKDGNEYGFSGVWSLEVQFEDETLYDISLLAPGRPDSMAGLRGLTNWINADRLLSMSKYEYPSENIEEESPISLGDAKELKKVLQAMKEGNQPVLNQYNEVLDTDYRDEIVTFLDPRIEMGAQLLDGMGHVFVGKIDNELREQREKPHLPRA